MRRLPYRGKILKGVLKEEKWNRMFLVAYNRGQDGRIIVNYNANIATNTDTKGTAIWVFILIFILTVTDFFSLLVMTAMGMTFHLHGVL